MPISQAAIEHYDQLAKTSPIPGMTIEELNSMITSEELAEVYGRWMGQVNQQEAH